MYEYSPKTRIPDSQTLLDADIFSYRTSGKGRNKSTKSVTTFHKPAQVTNASKPIKFALIVGSPLSSIRQACKSNREHHGHARAGDNTLDNLERNVKLRIGALSAVLSNDK